MRFTIVTPSFNQLDWLELCIASVADQQGVEFVEHIVQDAGTPGIEEFARRLGADFYRDGEKVGKWEGGSRAERDRLERSDSREAGSPAGEINVGRYEGSLRRLNYEGGSAEEQRRREGGNVERKGYSLTIYSEKDVGMYDAVNRGLLKASGEICAYLNCDEQYLPGTFAAVAERFWSNKSSGVVFGDIVVVDSEGNYICDRTAMVPTKQHTLVSGNLAVYSAATYFRREAVVDRGLLFSPEWKVVGDSVWILSLLDAGLKMGLLRRRVASFIYSGENLSLDVKGEQERAKLRATANPLAKASAPAIVAFFRMRRLLAGGYSLPSQDYAIFTDKSGPRREVFEVKQPTHRWPRQ